MPRTRNSLPKQAVPQRERTPLELLVPKRTSRGRRSEVVLLQWYDGAGELQYQELTPAQSWPYLSKN